MLTCVQVSPDEPLMAAGLDSLGSVELRNTLEGTLALALPPTLVSGLRACSNSKHVTQVLWQHSNYLSCAVSP
jgi:acyl carrier protein